MVDWIEVSRAAHQLQLDHGQRAHVHAARLAAESERNGATEDAEFWHAVSASLEPRAHEQK
jgi:hypothetical protein